MNFLKFFFKETEKISFIFFLDLNKNCVFSLYLSITFLFVCLAFSSFLFFLLHFLTIFIHDFKSFVVIFSIKQKINKKKKTNS